MQIEVCAPCPARFSLAFEASEPDGNAFRDDVHDHRGEADRPLSGVRVLVVEDDPDLLEILMLVMEHAGARVEAASSASEAMACIEAFRPDVLVSDIGMPEEDGYSLIRRVRAREARGDERLVAIAYTAFTSQADRDRALAAGFTAHLGKPAFPEAVVHKVVEELRIMRRL